MDGDVSALRFLGLRFFGDCKCILYTTFARARDLSGHSLHYFARFLEMPRRARPINLDIETRAELERIVRARSTSQGMALRARIVLAANRGMSNQQIAAQLDVTPSTVGKWREQYQRFGIAGLKDWGGRGRPTKYGDKEWQEFRSLLRQPPPDSKPRWTVRALAERLGFPRSTVHDMLLLERGKLRRKPTAPR